MIDYTKRILQNGLTVIVEQDRTTSLCAVNVLYKVGSKNEDPQRTGFAHLLEHLMFGGSSNVKDFDNIVQNAGGESNAFTNSDYTNYYEVLPFQNLEIALWIEADRMANLELTDANLAIQKRVVIEEFKEVCLNKPYGDNWHLLSSLAYEEHPYSWPTIGKEVSHIAEAKLFEVVHFYQNFYTPSNAILTISGPHDKEEVFDLVEKWFGPLHTSNTQFREYRTEQSRIESKYQKVHSNVPFAQFIGGCHMPGRNHPDYYACDLLSDILANGKSSRLYQNLVREKKTLTAVDCYLTGTFDPGLFVFEGRPASGNSIQDGIELFWNEVQEISTNRPDNRELQKVKNKVISSLAMSDLTVLNKAISMAYFEWLGSLDIMNQQEARYNAVSMDHIQDAAMKYLSPEKASIVEYQPQ